MEIERKESKTIEITEIELVEDTWARCKAHGWDNNEFWNKYIAPHKRGELVKVIIQLIPEHKIISCEEVTDKMLEEAFLVKLKQKKE